MLKAKQIHYTELVNDRNGLQTKLLFQFSSDIKGSNS